MYSERNHLLNGRFEHDLDNWTAVSAVYSAGDGDDHYGVATISQNGYIEQDFSIDYTRLHSIHIAVKAATTLTAGQLTLLITDSDGNTVTLQSLSGTAATWTENTIDVGLAAGSNFTIRITSTLATDIKVDDIWLWHVAMTRAAIATRVHTKLGRLATERSYNTTAAGALTEGSYTYAIDNALRKVDAIDEDTALPDIRWLDDSDLPTMLDTVEQEMIEQLQRDYAVEVDIRVGQRSESLSQISKSLSEMTTKDAKTGRVIVKKLTHKAEDFEL